MNSLNSGPFLRMPINAGEVAEMGAKSNFISNNFEVYHIKVGKVMTTQSHLILVVVAWSAAFLFHIEMISS